MVSGKRFIKSKIYVKTMNELFLRTSTFDTNSSKKYVERDDPKKTSKPFNMLGLKGLRALSLQSYVEAIWA